MVELIENALSGLVVAVWLGLVGAVFFQRNTGRKIAAGIFVGVACVRSVFEGQLSATEFYVVRALGDALVIFLLAGIQPVPRIVVLLHYICAAFFVLNVAGLALYWCYIGPIFYNVAYVLVSLWAFMVLIKKDEPNNGIYNRRGPASRFRFTFRQDILDDKEHEGRL